MAEATPVTLLTGFLGAGKTTLLNRLLRHRTLARTAVLANEFGETGIDHLLVEKIDDSTVLLNAGCICCSIRGDLVRALRTMLPRARRGDIERIVIETTGLADPAPILTTLLRDPAVAAAYRLAEIVTVADAVNGPATLDRYHEARRQVAVADRIVLAKTDLADAGAVTRAVRHLNPAAPLLTTEAASDPAALLDTGRDTTAARLAPPQRWSDGHDGGFASVSLAWANPLDSDALTAALQRVTATFGDRLLRLKGIVALRGQDRPHAVHAAGHLLHPPEALPPWPAGAARVSHLVLITDGLAENDARRTALDLLTPSLGPPLPR